MAETKKKDGIKLPKVRLMFDRILTTVKYKKETKGGILLGDGDKGIPYTKQTVVAVGPNASVTIGEEIEINFATFPTHKTRPTHGIGGDKEAIVLPIVNIDEEDYFFISSREINWIYEGGSK